MRSHSHSWSGPDLRFRKARGSVPAWDVITFLLFTFIRAFIIFSRNVKGSTIKGAPQTPLVSAAVRWKCHPPKFW